MLEREEGYFKNNRRSLLAEYRDRFVVIVGEEVVGHYDDQWTAIKTESRDNKREIGSFLVRQVTETDRPIIFRSRVRG